MESSNVTVPFEAGSPILVAGPTNSGKTHWIRQLLSNDMFTQPVASIFYCYGVYQPLYNEMKEMLPITFKEGLPTLDDIESLHDGQFHIIVLDDLMEKIVKSQDMQELFSKYCHHMNITAIFVSQNIFQHGPHTRTISLNCHVIVLFANKRDESQIHVIARQFYPLQWKQFLKVYRQTTREPYSYLMIDCTPSHPRLIQLRSHIFPPQVTQVYDICS